MRRGVVLLGLVAACAGGPPGAPPAAQPAPADVEISVFLIGDAGAPNPAGEPVLRVLAQELGDAPGERVVVFLGDNVYPDGMPDSAAANRGDAERRLRQQVEVAAAAGARAIFLPGNHDWARGATDGWEAVRRQTRYLASRGTPAVVMLPGNGCPGPAPVDVGRRLRLEVLDTQWWLHGGPKPQGIAGGCRAADERAVADSLRADLARAGDRHVFVVAHHPLATGGQHGGYFGIDDHLFPLRHLVPWLWLPLPGLGSIYPLSRQEGISGQDLTGSANRRMRAALEGGMGDHPPLVWASGHDHNLQVLDGASARHLLVSGAGIYGHESGVTRLVTTRFARADAGFMKLELLRDGRVRLAVLTVDRDARSRERFSIWLE
jgi:hypothetical protein